MFPYATQPDLYRAVEKDSTIVTSLRDQLQDVALHITGGRSVRWQTEIDAFSQAAYQAIKLVANPTLGEEYCDLIPVTVSHVRTTDQSINQSSSAVSNQQWRLPNRYDRRKHFLFTAIMPYMFERARVAALHATDGIHQSRHTTNQERFLMFLSRFLSFIDRHLSTLNRFHLAMFFLTGHYLNWADRLTGTRYLHVRALDSPRPKYATLGALILIQMFGTGMIELTSMLIAWYHRNQRERAADQLYDQSLIDALNPVDIDGFDDLSDLDDDEDEQVDGVTRRQCLLHLGPLRAPTALLCGHVLCWRCLAECGKQKPECPLCRSPFKLEELLRLANYG